MAELPPVMEAAVRMLELPLGEEAGSLERFVLKTEEPRRGVMPMGKTKNFGWWNWRP